MMFLALLAYSSVLRVSCTHPNISTHKLERDAIYDLYSLRSVTMSLYRNN